MDVMGGTVYGGCENAPEPFGPVVRFDYVLHYVTHGKGTYICDGKSYKVETGESFVVRPNHMVQWYPDKEEPWGYTWMIILNSDILTNLADQLIFAQDDCIIARMSPDIVLPMFEHLVAVGNIFETNNTRVGIAYGIIGAYIDAFKKNSPNVPVLYQKAIYYIEKNFYQKSCTSANLAKKLNVSSSTLYRIFKNNSGISPEKYIQNYRLEQATQMLEKGFSVKLVALSCGFSDPFYFSKVFKKIKGVIPTEYKAKQ